MELYIKIKLDDSWDDYKEVCDELIIEDLELVTKDGVSIEIFNLQNYTDRVCEKQRENCYNSFPDKLQGWVLNKLPIIEAEQPKMEEIV